MLRTLVLTVRVLEGGSGLVQLGSAPLVVLGFYGWSEPINSSVLSINPPGGVACSVRLMTSQSELPSVGRLVLGEESWKGEESWEGEESWQEKGDQCSPISYSYNKYYILLLYHIVIISTISSSYII